jgi:hypothetical protein
MNSSAPKNGSKTQWRFDLGKQILSFAVGVIVSAYVIGGARQRVHDLGVWRDTVAPKIERMDTVGTLSFEHWKNAHDKESDNWKAAHAQEQARNDERLKELEQEVKQLQRNPHP